jgi:hypothetical protein
MLLLGGLTVALLIGVIGWAALGTTQFTATTTRSFVVSGAPSVTLRDTAGNVTFHRGGDGRVTVQVTKVVRTLDESVARRELGAMTVTTAQNGNAISVDGNFSPTFFDGAPSSRSVDLVVTVPANATITGHLNAGNLAASGITGAQTLDTDAGNVTATDAVLADGSHLTTNAGNVTADVRVLQGAAIEMRTNAGNVTATLPANTPARLDAQVNAGNLTVSGWPISVTGRGPGHSASGDLGSPATGLVRMTTNAGNITVTAR